MSVPRHPRRTLGAVLCAMAAVVLVLGSSAALAGPNGEERSEEAHARNEERKAATSGGPSAQNNGDTRGASPSQPDQDGVGMDRGEFNGDEDKPPSGDGNNGCGNDADREDDNNGWCGKPEVSGGVTVDDEDEEGGAEVLGVRVQRPAEGVEAAAVAAGGSLATTGAGLIGLIPLGIALAALGAVMLLAARSRSAVR